MFLETSVYTAYRGYGWSAVPRGLSHEKLDRFYREISAARGDFPDPMAVEIGVIDDGTTVAFFTIQNVEQWDSERRSSNYAAFAFFPVRQASQIDFVELLNNDFFWTPSHQPQPFIDYSGGPSAKITSGDLTLVSADTYTLGNLRAAGSFFSTYGTGNSRLIGFLKAENILKINSVT